jgi:SPP1 family predicted phage head-tail adaptor
MKIKVGDLIHKITIQYNAAEGQTNDNGCPLEDWQPFITLYAKRSGLKGRLFYQAAAVQAENEVIFTIRYCEGIKAGMRIVEGTETFEVKIPPVDADGRRMWLEIHTRQVLQNGG